MEKPSLIVLFGKMRSGKSTLRENLEKNHGFRHVSIAAPVRAIEAAIRKTPLSIPPGATYPIREILQAIGEGGRQENESIWIRVAIQKIDELLIDGYNVVVDDARYENEYNDLQRYMMGSPDLHMQMIMLDCAPDVRFRRWLEGRVMRGSLSAKILQKQWMNINAHPSESLDWAKHLFPGPVHADRHLLDVSPKGISMRPEDVLRRVSSLWTGRGIRRGMP